MNDPFTPLEIVATNGQFCDPAIDADVPDADERMARYRETRELDALAWREGVERTVFVCQRVPAAYAACVLANMSGTTRLVSAVLAGCHLVRLPGGQTLAPKRAPRGGNHGVQIAESEWLDALRDRFGLETLYEIGRVIDDAARLPKGAKGPFYYPPG